MKHIALLMPFALAACATTAGAGAGRCDTKTLRPFVGAIATSEFSRLALKRSGAKTIRWTRPDTAVTMDYRMDRLNVRLDARNFITGIDCG